MRSLPFYFAAMALALIVSGPVCGGDTVDVASDRQTAQETASTSSQGVIHATLNGLGITIDARTGGIVGLSYDGPGQILASPASEAAAIDLAYPIKVFEPLRLASRFSKDAQVSVNDNEVTIHYNHLAQAGRVSSSRVTWLPQLISAPTTTAGLSS